MTDRHHNLSPKARQQTVDPWVAQRVAHVKDLLQHIASGSITMTRQSLYLAPTINESINGAQELIDYLQCDTAPEGCKRCLFAR
jgi:hypothetical protein